MRRCFRWKAYIFPHTIHTVKPLEVTIPKGRLTAVTGVSGSGKTTLILESLVPALEALIHHSPLPDHIRQIDAPNNPHVKLIDATPIGINVRSTVATYANVHDELRKNLQEQHMRSVWAVKPAIFPITQENFAVLTVTAQEVSAWMFSFSGRGNSHARTAEAPDMPKKHPDISYGK